MLRKQEHAIKQGFSAWWTVIIALLSLKATFYLPMCRSVTAETHTHVRQGNIRSLSLPHTHIDTQIHPFLCVTEHKIGCWGHRGNVEQVVDGKREKLQECMCESVVFFAHTRRVMHTRTRRECYRSVVLHLRLSWSPHQENHRTHPDLEITPTHTGWGLDALSESDCEIKALVTKMSRRGCQVWKGNKGKVLLGERMQEWNIFSQVVSKLSSIELFADNFQKLICKCSGRFSRPINSKTQKILGKIVFFFLPFTRV